MVSMGCCTASGGDLDPQHDQVPIRLVGIVGLVGVACCPAGGCSGAWTYNMVPRSGATQRFRSLSKDVYAHPV